MMGGMGLACLALLLVSAVESFGVYRRRFVPRLPVAKRQYPGTQNTTTHFFEQRLDHFSFSTSETFKQRYYTYDKYYKKGGPIFFYCGNEANVELYVNATGLIWENAQEFGAYIVFAEHRFYGESMPTSIQSEFHGNAFLSHELALADYAVLIQHLRNNVLDSPYCAAIAFGGSYGGKLAAWMRMKYPAAVAGAISASAPLLAFRGADPPWPTQSYYKIITNAAGRYDEACPKNVRAALGKGLEALVADEAGRMDLSATFKLCKPLPAGAHGLAMLRYFVRDAFDELAMGNYPWPSNYIAGTAAVPMPAWPLGKACAHLSDPSLVSAPSLVSEKTKVGARTVPALYESLMRAVSVLYNVSGAESCYTLPDYPTPALPGGAMGLAVVHRDATRWSNDSYWFGTDGVTDMFWANPYNQTFINQHCEAFWGVTPAQQWIAVEYGARSLLNGHSNIVFSSGGYDGWSSGGVAVNVTAASLTSIYIRDGGHHLDLMFSHPDDPPSVTEARAFELSQIREWLAQHGKQEHARSWGDLA